MVFSQTSQKTHSILKVVDLNRLKPNKNQQENDGLTGVVIEDSTQQPLSPVATTSFSEEFLKPEPLYGTVMFHDSDSEFFQDLVQWCSTPAKEEQVQIIDSIKPTEETHKTDTLNEQFSPRGWNTFDVNSSALSGFDISTPNDPLSPSEEGLIQYNKFSYPQQFNPPQLESERNMFFPEQFSDISSLPVVIGDLAPEGVKYIYNTDYSTLHNSTVTLPFIDQEDSLDTKLPSVAPQELDNNTDVVISEYNLVETQRPTGLTLDVSAPHWPSEINTPDVLNCVQQLEDKCPQSNMESTALWPMDTNYPVFTKFEETTDSPLHEYEPITPKSESLLESDQVESPQSTKRPKNDSEDSDETYTPYSDRSSPRKYKRRKPNVPIKEMILALEGSQQITKARRGRPPKRRQSTVSSVCSTEDNASTSSTHENKYRELRDKNNEASKRSRMSRKLKELQMEQLALDLEDRNKKLKVKADVLEDMTKRLKDALMSAILQK